MTTTFATFLSDDDVRQVHSASLEILERVGMLVRNEKAHAVFARHGCQTRSGSPLVRFPRAVIEEFRAHIPPRFTFYGRDPRFDRTLPEDAPVIITGSSAPNLVDPVTGKERRSTSEDIARIARLVNELPGYDVFSVSTLAEDAPPGYYSLARLYPTLRARTTRICGAPDCWRGSGPPSSSAPCSQAPRRQILLPGACCCLSSFCRSSP